jgi:hypothetical protein
MKNGVLWDVTPCGSCQDPHGVISRKTPFFTAFIVSEITLSTWPKKSVEEDDNANALCIICKSVRLRNDIHGDAQKYIGPTGYQQRRM